MTRSNPTSLEELRGLSARLRNTDISGSDPVRAADLLDALCSDEGIERMARVFEGAHYIRGDSIASMRAAISAILSEGDAT